MRRRIIAAFLLSLVAGLAMSADRLGFFRISATSTVSNTTLAANTKAVTIANNTTSANEIYFDLYTDAETPAAATTASKELQPGESLTFSFSSTSTAGLGATYWKTLSIICDTAETATVRIYTQ